MCHALSSYTRFFRYRTVYRTIKYGSIQCASPGLVNWWRQALLFFATMSCISTNYTNSVKGQHFSGRTICVRKSHCLRLSDVGHINGWRVTRSFCLARTREPLLPCGNISQYTQISIMSGDFDRRMNGPYKSVQRQPIINVLSDMFDWCRLRPSDWKGAQTNIVTTLFWPCIVRVCLYILLTSTKAPSTHAVLIAWPLCIQLHAAVYRTIDLANAAYWSFSDNDRVESAWVVVYRWLMLAFEPTFVQIHWWAM